MKYLPAIMIVCLTIGGCKSSLTPAGQLALRAIEVRPIDAPYEIAFRAATHAIFALGLNIQHTEKDSGILTANRQETHTGRKLGWALLLGAGALLMDTDTEFTVTMFLSPMGEKQTRLRIGIVDDGEVITDQTMVDQIWVLTQREALIESGETVPEEINKKANQILSGEEIEEEQKENEE